MKMTIQTLWAVSWVIHRRRISNASIENNENCNVGCTDLKWLKEKQLT